jgi:hypothetical protein
VLVGVGRIRIVRDLAAAWEAAVGEGRMSLVVVEGRTGIGKTAVVRALYEQLAMRQARPAYWPATFEAPAPRSRKPSLAAGEVNGSQGTALTSPEVAQRRTRAARIYPVDLAPAEGSRPGFFWWGLTARPEEFAVLGGDAQIKRHVQGIAEAVARGDRLARDQFVTALKGAAFLASLGLLGPALAGLSASFTALRDARELVQKGSDVSWSRAGLLEVALHRTSGTVFSVTAQPQAADAAEEDARCLGLMASVLPMLVAVEAAQFLDSVTIALLRVLLRQTGSAGLIVLLVDTDQPVDQRSGVPGEALGDWLSTEDWAQGLTRVWLDPLSADEITEIAVAELGPGLNPGMLARVVDYAGDLVRLAGGFGSCTGLARGRSRARGSGGDPWVARYASRFGRRSGDDAASIGGCERTRQDDCSRVAVQLGPLAGTPELRRRRRSCHGGRDRRRDSDGMVAAAAWHRDPRVRCAPRAGRRPRSTRRGAG